MDLTKWIEVILTEYCATEVNECAGVVFEMLSPGPDSITFISYTITLLIH